MIHMPIVQQMKCNDFCGCEIYYADEDVSSKVYICLFFSIGVMMLWARIGAEWFVFKDYYPLKERSPVLCILMATLMTIQMLLYPLLYVLNYFTEGFPTLKQLHTIGSYALDGSVFLIYFMRSSRLVFAHEVHSSRSSTPLFQYYRHEYRIALTILGILLLKILPIIFNLDDDTTFYTFIEFNSFYRIGSELSYSVKQIIYEFAWILILIYCLALQRKVHRKYSMKTELSIVIGIRILGNLSSMVLTGLNSTEDSLFMSLCAVSEEFPVLQIIKDLGLIGMYMTSIMYPLLKKKIYHMLLPTGRVVDLPKTMRDFLMEPQFLDIFTLFLLRLDSEQQQGRTYSRILENWKSLMVLKYSANHQDDQRVSGIKQIVQDIQEANIKEIHSKMIQELKKSILSMEDSDSDSVHRNQYMEQINGFIEQLEIIFLEKLDQFYKQEYRKTQSYHNLKFQLERNKRINVNMILLNMAVMLDSEEAL